MLVTGPTGSGKSTTLAALLDLVNRTRDDHIITIEDPIEFVHPSKRCLVNQREVGAHTDSFARALRAALREDPDVVLVGEMRDLETTSIAIETAETGHLVFGTLHTTSATATIERLINQFPADRQEQVRLMLADSLKAVISQNLLKRIGGGRVAAQEILICNRAVGNLIRENKAYQITSIMQTGKARGNVMLNEALMKLVEDGFVAPREAYLKAVDKDDLLNRLRRRGSTSSSGRAGERGVGGMSFGIASSLLAVRIAPLGGAPFDAGIFLREASAASRDAGDPRLAAQRAGRELPPAVDRRQDRDDPPRIDRVRRDGSASCPRSIACSELGVRGVPVAVTPGRRDRGPRRPAGDDPTGGEPALRPAEPRRSLPAAGRPDAGALRPARGDPAGAEHGPARRLTRRPRARRRPAIAPGGPDPAGRQSAASVQGVRSRSTLHSRPAASSSSTSSAPRQSSSA